MCEVKNLNLVLSESEASSFDMTREGFEKQVLFDSHKVAVTNVNLVKCDFCGSLIKTVPSIRLHNLMYPQAQFGTVCGDCSGDVNDILPSELKGKPITLKEIKEARVMFLEMQIGGVL